MKEYLYYYPLISLILTIICYLKTISANIYVDPFETLKRINDYLEELKETNRSLAEFLERIVNSALEGNKLVVIMFIYSMFLIPVFRWILIVSVFKEETE